MNIAIVTFDGFNEIDSIVAAHILNRVDIPGWKAEITAPTQTVTSMNGVVVFAQQPLEFLTEADAVIVGSGHKTRQAIEDASIMSRIKASPEHQLLASQCSGALGEQKEYISRAIEVVSAYIGTNKETGGTAAA